MMCIKNVGDVVEKEDDNVRNICVASNDGGCETTGRKGGEGG